ncbi:MAG TPA: deoxynucleoside kinase, partial [Trueperaceae bacterium]|nr:deoxynucleoside kinase [Trueperaceae bacterium]
MYIAIAGNIGAGKSSLTRILAKRYHLKAVYEAVDENPYLEDFYKDMRRYAFHSQIFFLSKRLEQHLEQVNKISRTIQDRTIYEDAAIFAQNLYQEG